MSLNNVIAEIPGAWRVRYYGKRISRLCNMLWLKYPQRVCCNICGWSGRCFRDDSWHPMSVCPSCDSEMRQRLLSALINDWIDSPLKDISRNKRILHFAPEPYFEAQFRLDAARYVSADISRRDVDTNLDISQMDRVGSGEFDVVIAIDVFEHVPDDHKAFDEINRVLSSGGLAILSVPQKDGLLVTDEGRDVTTDDERERRFGVNSHLRFYGADFSSRFTCHGFNVKRFDQTVFDAEFIRRHVLFPPILSESHTATNKRAIYVGTKI